MKVRGVLSLSLGLTGFLALPALASPSGVVISGFQVRGTAGGNDEFVELHNTSNAPVSIAGWKLMGCASGTPGTASSRVTVANGVTLTAGQYYLFTNNASSGYSGTVTGDATYATGFTDFSSTNYSGIEIVDASATVQDAVGSPLSPCHEGTGLSTPTTNSASDAYARNGGGVTDTNNNASDFVGPESYTPHNSGGIVAGGCPNDGIRIYTIQGKSHISQYNGLCVSNVPGIVTAVSATGFYLQDGDGDGDVNTSDGIFVFTSTVPTVTVGSEVKVGGTVAEYRPAAAPADLTITEIDSPTITAASGLFTHDSISPTIIGNGGRVPPTQFIDTGTTGSVEVASETTYDPSTNGIDFYESLEGMLVQINNARVVGPTDSYGQIWLVGDAGVNATGINARGGISLVDRAAGQDYNPERVMIDVSYLTTTYPMQNVGDSVAQVTGVMSYDFGDYRIFPSTLPTFTAGGLQPQTESLPGGTGQVAIAAYNVDNLDPNDNDVCDGAPDQDVASGKFTRLGAHIANNLGSPAIISIQEIQDNDGCTDDGVTDDSLTISTLVSAIKTAGGPSYSTVEVQPVNDQDGGVPGGNIRQVLFYDPTRVTYVPGTSGAGDSTTATALSLDANGNLQLSLSPGRVDPTDSAWTTSRKPLAATFDVNGHRLLIIANHLDSKGGDDPLYGPDQPPVLSSAVQRQQQGQILHDFVAQALSLDANARVVVLGDFNDWAFSTPLQVMDGESVGQQILTDLSTALLTDTERYSYVYEGNSEELDHIYVTSALLSGAQFQAVHVNSEFAVQTSDHDPLLSSLSFPLANVAPVADAGSNQTVAYKRKTTVTLNGSASHDPDGTIVSYQWSQTSGTAVVLSGAQSAIATFPAPKNGGTLVFKLTVTDNLGAQSSASTTVTITSGRGGRGGVSDDISDAIDDAVISAEDAVFSLFK